VAPVQPTRALHEERHIPNPWPLVALTAVVVLLSLTGVIPDWPGIVHAVGLPPLGLITDLRILFVETPSYPLFLGSLALAMVVRSMVLATMIGAFSWAAVWFSLRFYLVALPLALLSAAAFFASPATLFYLLFWIGLVFLIVEMALFAAVPWTEESTLRAAFVHQARRGFRLGTLGAYLLLVTLLGALAEAGGRATAILLVPVSAGLTYATVYVLAVDPDWRWLRIGRRSLAMGAYVALYALLLVVVTGPPSPVEADDEPPQPRDGSLLLMSGVDSSSGSGAILEIDPLTLGFTCEQTYYYSYAGAGDGQPQNDAQCPIRTGAPYHAEHTFGATAELVQHFVDQVEDLPTPVTVATHSQGVWIVWHALAEHGAMGVADLVLIGPFPDNPVSYPPFRDREPGRVGTDVIDHLVANLARPGGTSGFEHDSPLAVELLSNPEGTARIWDEPLPDEIAVLTVTSTLDLPLVGGHHVEGATDACPVPVAHPNLPYASQFVDAVNRHLDGRQAAGCAWWRTGIGTLGRPFSVPPTGA
jgi:hypothetical protein